MDIEFGEPVYDKRTVWQDIIYKGEVIGALSQRDVGLLLEPIVHYQRLIPSSVLATIPAEEYDRSYPSEDEGFDFVIVYDLDKFMALYAKYCNPL